MSKPPTELDEMKDHAETFDLNFIKRKVRTIYCYSETLIYDYAILKAITSKDLGVVIVANGKNDQKLIKDVLFRRIEEVSLRDTLVRHTLSDQLKFKNTSKIQILNYDYDAKPLGGMRGVDLLYIRNTALSQLYYNLAIENFTNYVHINGRVIYNFDV